MAAFSTTTIDHVKSFNVVNTVEGANEATREIFDNIKTENLNRFEGLMLRNTFIASENYTGGMDGTVSAATVTQNNPAGSFRSLLVPKGDTEAMTAISSLGEIQFEKFGTDDITLKIDEYVRTPFKLLYAIDTGNGGSGWLVSDMQSHLSMQAISALVRQNNYKVFETIKQGSIYQTDNLRGTQGRILVTPGSETPKQFTDGLIDAIADYGVTPEDRYVTGFDEDELVISITYKGHAKLLKEKLAIFEGMREGEASAFYQGLPYTHTFAGASLVKSKFINSATTDIEAEYVITPLGGYSPFLFHLARFAGRAEVAPMTDGAISVYGTLLTGMKTEGKLDQHITVKVTASTKPTGFTNKPSDLKLIKTDTGELTLSGAVDAGATEAALYDAQTGAVVVAAAPFTGADIVFAGLTSGKDYKAVVAGATIASPESHTFVNGDIKQNVYNLFARA